jgi:hypothetical protein
MELDGVVYTLDALHCQKKTFEMADNENPEEKKTLLSSYFNRY